MDEPTQPLGCRNRWKWFARLFESFLLGAVLLITHDPLFFLDRVYPAHSGKLIAGDLYAYSGKLLLLPGEKKAAAEAVEKGIPTQSMPNLLRRELEWLKTRAPKAPQHQAKKPAKQRIEDLQNQEFKQALGTSGYCDRRASHRQKR
jgi:ATPase subunit of ABC transporter with duplicated ATPase domains